MQNLHRIYKNLAAEFVSYSCRISFFWCRILTTLTAIERLNLVHECRLSTRWLSTLRPSQPTWTVGLPAGCYHPQRHCCQLLLLLKLITVSQRVKS